MDCVLHCHEVWRSFGRITICVERYIDDPEDALNSSILETMSYTDKHILKIIGDMGGIETAVKALKKYLDDTEGIAWHGYGLISNVE